jgi:hypothetical protein
MSVVVSINGREAIPVRAIPYVTGWDVSPDMLRSRWQTLLMGCA